VLSVLLSLPPPASGPPSVSPPLLIAPSSSPTQTADTRR